MYNALTHLWYNSEVVYTYIEHLEHFFSKDRMAVYNEHSVCIYFIIIHLNVVNYSDLSRGRPWRYSVIPSTPDFQTEYQICRHSNPAGLPVFTAIWGPDFRASIIILTHMLKQIKRMRITLMTMFKANTSQPKEKYDNLYLYATTRNSSDC